jgi:murein DD-endopeptidase MepM/ murein hydrolase activator NlpD
VVHPHKFFRNYLSGVFFPERFPVLTDRRTTISIIPEDKTRVKHFKFSRGFLVVMACLLALSVLAVSAVLYDYSTLKKTLPAVHALEREVTHQRAQIQAFAKKIGTLKLDIAELQESEKRLRALADIEPSTKDAPVFGIGGPMPEDLNPELSLNKKHDGLVRQMHDQVEYLSEVSAMQREAFRDLRPYLESRKSLLAATPSIRPTSGWISSGFGYRKSPFTGRREFHQGMDIATRMGTPVVAPADGTITFVGRKGGLGRALVVDHGHGFVTRYGHLKKCLVKNGACVKRGDKIALVGNSGRTTAPHLHYEVRLNGLPVNPKKYILK